MYEKFESKKEKINLNLVVFRLWRWEYMSIKRIECRKCKHYYITWDKNFPYGCKLFKVKSKQMPCVIVYQSIGKQCENYENS
jgi:hypothetical protein